jgi:hypothetical protein
MSPQKTPGKRGLLPKLKGFMDALGERYHRVIQVIDEALASESLKDKIWAVDLILKRTPGPEALPTSKPEAEAETTPADLASLSETELLAEIRKHLKDWEP